MDAVKQSYNSGAHFVVSWVVGPIGALDRRTRLNLCLKNRLTSKWDRQRHSTEVPYQMEYLWTSGPSRQSNPRFARCRCPQNRYRM